MYAKKVERFNHTYGAACWWLVAQADQRMRSEQMERIRRRLEFEKQVATATVNVHPLDPAMPWDLRLKEAAADTKFWDEDLHAKAVLYITHLKSKYQLSDPGYGLVLDGGSRAVASHSHSA